MENRPFPALAAANIAALSFLEAALSALPNAFSDLLSLLLACEGAGGVGQGMRSAKGAIIDIAIIAGTMAVKNTAQWIPFCHALAIEGCDFSIDWHDRQTLRILCTVRVTGKTGVEMEALTGTSAAALTVYDMCKALSHAIEIGPVKLRHKQGGKRRVGGK